MLEKVELFLYRRSHRIVSLTNSFKQNLIDRGIDGAKNDVITNGVDIDRFQSDLDPAIARERLGVAADAFLLGYIGTIGMAHGLRTVLDAAESLSDRPKVHFVLIGDGAERAGLESYAAELKLQNVTFSDYVPHDQIPAYLSALDMSVVHLKPDPLFLTVIPSKIFESMAVGTPILMAVQGESAQIVEDTGSGFCIPSGDSKLMAKTIRELESDRNRLATMSHSGRDAVATKYSREANAKRFIDSMQAAIDTWNGVESPDTISFPADRIVPTQRTEGSVVSANEKLLVTGASGFLGRRVVDQAVEAGIDVRCTGRSKTPPTPMNNYQSADLTDASSVEPLFDSVGSVVHSAGLAHQFGKQTCVERRFHEINVDATANVVQAAVDSSVNDFVLVSSVSVYGTQSTSPVEEDAACCPVGPYATSKWQAEQVAIDIASKSAMRLTILRMATIYGAGDPGNVLKLMRTIDRGRFVWIGRGQNKKSLIHVDDAASACLRAIASPSQDTSLKIYNVSATPESMHSIVRSIGTSLDKPVRRWHIPASLPIAATAIVGRITPAGSFVRRVNGTLTKWIANDAYDGSRFCEDYDFHPNTNLADGIRNEADWYRKSA